MPKEANLTRRNAGTFQQGIEGQRHAGTSTGRKTAAERKSIIEIAALHLAGGDVGDRTHAFLALVQVDDLSIAQGLDPFAPLLRG